MAASLNCPACSHKLKSKTVGGVTVDICHGGCGGMWFDNFELQKFEEPHEDAGESLMDMPVDPTVHIDHRRKRSCPHCDGIKLMRRCYSPKRKVEVDECGSCGGMWLDLGELETIRTQFSSAQERTAVIREFVDSTVQPYIVQARSQKAEGRKHARIFGRVFGFLGIH